MFLFPEDVTFDPDEPMDFSIVSSMIVQKLFPQMVEHEVTSTVGDCPSPQQENKPPKLPPPPPMLPPCRVCAEKASGFHYGANTCEACKVSIHGNQGNIMASSMVTKVTS